MIMKKSIKKALLIAVMIIPASGLFAQHIQTQYFLNIPQSSQMNPAFRPGANLYIGIPGLSDIQLGMSNNLLDMKMLFSPLPGTDSVMTILHPEYDRDDFFRRLGRKGFVSAGGSTQLLGLGFATGNGWWLDFGLSVNGRARAMMPADLFTLALKGNEEFVGSSADLSGAGFNAQAYVKTHIGLSKNITEKLRVGGRLNILQGAMSASLVAEELELQVNPDYSHALNTDVYLKLSGPFDVSLDEDGFIEDIMFREQAGFSELAPSFKNFGLSVDAGAEYLLMDNLRLSASITDLGFIRWGRESYTFRATNSFTFDGFDVSNVMEGTENFDQMIEEFADSLLTTFDFVDSEDPYSTGLPAKLYLGASYQPLNYLSLGILSRTTMGMGVRESLTLSATLLAGDVLSASLSYTMTNRTFNNFGFGMGLRGGPFQFFAVIDQIPSSWVEFSSDNGNDSSVLPRRLDYMNLRFGLNLLFGRGTVNGTGKPMLAE